MLFKIKYVLFNDTWEQQNIDPEFTEWILDKMKTIHFAKSTVNNICCDCVIVRLKFKTN